MALDATPDEILKEKTAAWLAMKSRTAEDGEAQNQGEVDAFYYREILPLSVEKARARWEKEHGHLAPYHVVISILGFSPPATIIACLTLRPEHLILITSEEAAEGIDIVAEAVVSGGMAFRNFHHHRCNPSDPLDIYAKVKAALEGIRVSPMGAVSRAIIDITGGKKVMSAAAALAAWRLNLPLCYVESRFDPNLRVTIPGTEYVIFLDNPVNIYREEEFAVAMDSFNGGRYLRAQEDFERLSVQLSNPVPARFMATLSNFYSLWCDLDFDGLAGTSCSLVAGLAEMRRHNGFHAGKDERLDEQIAFVRRLVDGEPPARLLAFLLLGRHYSHGLGRRDFAALFFYRTLEGCLVQRLAELHPCFAVIPVDYPALGRDLSELLIGYNQVAATLGEGQRESGLPPRLGLMNSAALLLALGDSLLPETGYGPPKGLGELMSLAEIRNGSILAHGQRSVSKEDCEKLEKAAIRLLQGMFRLSKWTFPGKGLDDACDRLSFVNFEPGQV